MSKPEKRTSLGAEGRVAHTEELASHDLRVRRRCMLADLEDHESIDSYRLEGTGGVPGRRIKNLADRRECRIIARDARLVAGHSGIFPACFGDFFVGGGEMWGSIFVIDVSHYRWFGFLGELFPHSIYAKTSPLGHNPKAAFYVLYISTDQTKY
jgi:hypothetical protein